MNDYLILTFIGGFTGILAGFVGGGSDVLIVPMLLFFHVFSNIKTAIGTSLAMLLPPVGLFAVYDYYKEGNMNIKYATYLAICFTIFSTLSAKMGINFPKKNLKKIYSIFLIIIGIITLFIN
tara:strand:+ start:135 stop:500 length:366 start_codon:yes stop_codon:yes gene_type:complete